MTSEVLHKSVFDPFHIDIQDLKGDLLTEGETIRERRRLAVLESYDILDTPREKDFDDIASLASKICGTPIAVVNLIADRRQFFMSEVGLGVRETPFDSSFCVKAILEDEFLMIPDATKDHRFDCNPLVTGEPHIRFYAGAVLKTSEGLPIGTVCVLGYQPKALDDLQQETLRVLARQVMVQLELRKAIRQKAHEAEVQRRLGERRLARLTAMEDLSERLKVHDARSRVAQAAGRVGTFELDNATDTMSVSPELCGIFGLPPRDTYPASAFEELVIDEDSALRSDKIVRANGTARLDVDYRIRRADDGELRWVSRRARFVTDDSGNITRMVGVMFDTTDIKSKDAKTLLLLKLGDSLRKASTVKEISGLAAGVIAEGLGVGRAGYATVDIASNSVTVESHSTSPKMQLVAESHPITAFPATFDRLLRGETVTIGDVSTESWVSRDLAGYKDLGIRSLINVPILNEGVLAGILCAQDTEARTWTRDELDFTSGITDRTYAGIAKVRAEDEQALLNHELSHRLKNTLAMVQAIASQTLKEVTERDAVAAFAARLQALSAAHDILLQQNWSSAKMQEVIEKVLALHADRSRISIKGPELSLGPKAGLSLSLLLHELATNAVKYGALSNNLGQVMVDWSVEDANGIETMSLTWTESGGPQVQEPTRKGFGSRLIQMGLAGTGNAQRSFLPSGLTANFRAPLMLIQEIGI